MTLTAACAILLGACGGGVDQQTAAMAFSEASTAQKEANTEVQKGMSTLKGDLTVSGTPSSFAINGTVNAKSGVGSAAIAGSGSRTSTTAFAYKMTMTFNGWKGSAGTGLILDGPLSYDVSVSGSGLTASSTTIFKGDLTLSGAKTGTASFDLTIKTEGLKVCISGTVGGHAIASAAMPGC